MESRSTQLHSIRPEIDSIKKVAIPESDEHFQNETLRPIIKFQNDLLVSVFRNYIRKHKNAYHKLNHEGKLKYIENAIQKDIKFRNSLKGMVIGQFTVEEYNRYIATSSALNKRMMNMVIVRLKDQILLFEMAVLQD